MITLTLNVLITHNKHTYQAYTRPLHNKPTKEIIMAKGRNAQKAPEKKKSDKTLKEKRAEKKEKKLKNEKNI